jgi:isocitrate dehydrogenase
MGDEVTYDFERDRNEPSAVGTSEYADAIIEQLGA